MTELASVTDMNALLWLIAEQRIDTNDARLVPLLQQALDDGLAYRLPEDESDARLKLTDEGRQRIGLPLTSSADAKGADWLGTMGRRAFSRF